ncbi:cytochrome P450 3A24-like [Lytechinus pictus]|uniref:cytochrome P450 3A24-like n=1 Tax=Lytechinus pictus TaxID=7653 RepID=UPI0030B9D4A3
MDKSLFFLRDSRWKKVRNVTSQSFSANKMKKMSLLVNEKADRLVENIGKEQAKSGFVECKQLYGYFVMDSISACAFGLDVDSQDNPGHPFVDHAKKVIQSGFVFSPLIAITAIFPWLAGIFRYFNIGLLKSDSLRFFRDIATQAITIRRSTANKENKRMDFLQLMVDATRQKHEDGTNQKEPQEDIDDDLKIQHENDKDSVHRDAKMSKPIDDDEFTAQAMFFLFGGYENTSSLCGFSSYFLARNPEIQDKLIKEIDEVTPASESVNYTTIAKMTYLDHVIRETLRLYPIAPLISRVCTKEYEVNGFTIPKGMQVDIPIYTIQRDPEIWPEPDKFIPERFTKENLETTHPYSWIPFGTGPRMCIGMRFAVMETKIALVRVLREFRLETCPQTEIPPKTGSIGLVTPKNGIALRVVRRN